MRVFLITAFVALTVASPDIGLQLRQQQQGTIGHAYLPPQQNQQLNQQYYEQQQQTFTVHHNGNPAQLTSNNPEDVFIKYDTQQEADKNSHYEGFSGSSAPVTNSNESQKGAQSSSVVENLNKNYLPPFQQQQGFDYQPQHHNQQFIQQEQTYTLNQGVNQNNGQGFGNNEGLEPSFSSPLFQEPIITKHVYFHTAPEEDEQPQRVQIRQQIVSPQKHYKIIFIKAPSNGISQDIQVPAHPQTEEKTIVYVLSKKQESIDVQYEEPAPLVPSKPEVFFIKYKTQKEAINQNVAADYMALAPTKLPSNNNGVAPGKIPGAYSSGSSGPIVAIPATKVPSNPLSGGSSEGQKPNMNYLPPFKTLNTKTAY